MPGEAEDFEMRDVRRDGLIEALLIAFTPPRGLPYPRVYPTVYPTSPTDPRGGRISWTPLLPSLPSSFAASHRHLFSFLITTCITVPFVCTRRSAARAVSYGLRLSRSLFVCVPVSPRRGSVPPFSPEQTAAPLYKRAHRRRRSVRDLGDEETRASKQEKDRKRERERT